MVTDCNYARASSRRSRSLFEVSCVLLLAVGLLYFTDGQNPPNGLPCPNTAPAFNNSRVLYFIQNNYIVYECIGGYEYENNTDGILWCNTTVGAWTGNPGTCKFVNPCSPNPCVNGGFCSTAEDPFGWGYYCYCLRAYGGRHCQVVNPCQSAPCPSNTICFRTCANDTGRFCYNTNTWQLVD